MEQKILNAFDSVRFGMDTKANKQLDTELKFALKSYRSYMNWVCYTTYPHANEIMKIVNHLMSHKEIWQDSKGGVVRQTINFCKDMKAKYLSPKLMKNYGILKSYTYKFSGGANKLTEDINSGALVGGVTAYHQSGLAKADVEKVHRRLNKIKAVGNYKRFDESGKVVNTTAKGRDINAVVNLIASQCKDDKGIGINILTSDEFAKYPTSRKISALNYVLSKKERNKKFSLENDTVGQTLLIAFKNQIQNRSGIYELD